MTKRVLVVDDEPAIRDLLALILEGEGYDVACATDGLDALRVANDTPHDAILLDLKMPGIDGAEFARRYRRSGGRAPIVVVSAARGAEEQIGDIERCGYLGKPFELQALLDAVHACVAPLAPSAR